ncbi:hypothetical protein GUJ93_ZPchr0004g40016 [Zizania palustris]|uniref:Uncharacterized protein n=1 Tax=Zizania palustris TaxID=103762 RepID=A0A8J5V8T3_ZIZPA|nr:hypothetical protein GUJ93_ZPchr0004g40016 [Zizania palustris]
MRAKVVKLDLAAVLAYRLFDAITYTELCVLAFLGYEKSIGKNREPFGQSQGLAREIEDYSVCEQLQAFGRNISCSCYCSSSSTSHCFCSPAVIVPRNLTSGIRACMPKILRYYLDSMALVLYTGSHVRRSTMSMSYPVLLPMSYTACAIKVEAILDAQGL